MTWDILPEREREYFEFIIAELIPGLQRLGLQPVEAWATLYGNYPQIQIGLLAVDVQRAHRVLESSGWGQLKEKLSGFITNYYCKIVPARGGFQF
jgi:hypothetical protein